MPGRKECISELGNSGAFYLVTFLAHPQITVSVFVSLALTEWVAFAQYNGEDEAVNGDDCGGCLFITFCRHCARYFTHTSSLTPCDSFMRYVLFYFHFTDEVSVD